MIRVVPAVGASVAAAAGEDVVAAGEEDGVAVPEILTAGAREAPSTRGRGGSKEVSSELEEAISAVPWGGGESEDMAGKLRRSHGGKGFGEAARRRRKQRTQKTDRKSVV